MLLRAFISVRGIRKTYLLISLVWICFPASHRFHAGARKVRRFREGEEVQRPILVASTGAKLNKSESNHTNRRTEPEKR